MAAAHRHLNCTTLNGRQMKEEKNTQMKVHCIIVLEMRNEG